MPYEVVRQGGRWVVFRKASSGRPRRKLGEHDSQDSADRQVAAIHAVKEREGSS